jgi:deoxyribose-phosphate aldolase
MNIASYIDHTILKPDTTLLEVKEICKEAMEHNFASVCVPPYYVREVSQILENSLVKTSTVIGFPFGYNAVPAKAEEIKRALHEGADEVDTVININAVKCKNWNYLRSEIDTVIMATHLHGKKIKVILETGLLTEEEILKIIDICNPLLPDFIKTSTGFNGAGATKEMVAFLKKNVDSKIKIKASGGIKTVNSVKELIDAGASRIGTSSGLSIIKG